MIKKSGGVGRKPKQPKDKVPKDEQSMSEYAASQISEGAVIDFVFYDDFDLDGSKEAVIGITRFTPFPPDSAVLLVQKKSGKMEHKWLSTVDKSTAQDLYGIYDNAVAADTDGDGKLEIVISQVMGHEHDISVFLFDWTDEGVQLAWHSKASFYHGSMEVNDINRDGIAEIVIESGTLAGSEIIEMQGACYHVRKGSVYKWNGQEYAESSIQVRMPYESYNTAVDFIRSLWLRQYERAYDMVVMPGFLGLAGLDDSSLPAFKTYISRKVRPVLLRNLSRGKLHPSEPYDTCCQFTGSEDCFTVELVRVENVMKVNALEITKKSI